MNQLKDQEALHSRVIPIAKAKTRPSDKEIIDALALEVNTTERFGTEVILNTGRNKFFNVGMYLDGKSWAKDVRIVKGAT